MTCHYCGEYDTRSIDDERVCIYCFEHLQNVQNVQKDDRKGFIDARLQKLYDLLVVAQSPSPYIKGWVESVVRRLAFLRHAASVAVTVEKVEVVAPAAPAKKSAPLKLKIKKFR